MIPATLATVALALLVYAYILSPIIRELRHDAVTRRPADADHDGADDTAAIAPSAAAAPSRSAMGQADVTEGEGNRAQRAPDATGDEDSPASTGNGAADGTGSNGTSASSSGA